MSFFNTCIIGQAMQISGLSNKNLILIGENFLYVIFKTMHTCFNSSYILIASFFLICTMSTTSTMKLNNLNSWSKKSTATITVDCLQVLKNYYLKEKEVCHRK